MTDIEQYLINNNYDPALSGFDYTVYAIELIRKDISYKNEICNLLYPSIAKKFNTSSSKVERAIRHFKSKQCSNINNSTFLSLLYLKTKDITFEDESVIKKLQEENEILKNKISFYQAINNSH